MVSLLSSRLLRCTGHNESIVETASERIDTISAVSDFIVIPSYRFVKSSPVAIPGVQPFSSPFPNWFICRAISASDIRLSFENTAPIGNGIDARPSELKTGMRQQSPSLMIGRGSAFFAKSEADHVDGLRVRHCVRTEPALFHSRKGARSHCWLMLGNAGVLASRRDQLPIT
jgi:hypothetical protein